MPVIVRLDVEEDLVRGRGCSRRGQRSRHLDTPILAGRLSEKDDVRSVSVCLKSGKIN
jgi:hypothetical protein